MNGWTPPISTNQKIHNLAKITGPELAVMVLVDNEDDLWMAERTLAGIAQLVINDPEADALCAYFDGIK